MALPISFLCASALALSSTWQPVSDPAAGGAVPSTPVSAPEPAQPGPTGAPAIAADPAPVHPEPTSGQDQAQPLLAPAFDVGAWSKKRRKLQIQTGISGGLSGLFLASGLLMLFAPASCRHPDPDFGCGEGYGRFYGSIVLFSASVVALIPAIVYGVRLHRHNQTRPGTARLQLAPGGLTLRF